MKSDWVYCGVTILDTIVFGRRPYWFGQVEFSPLDWDDAECTKMRKASISAYGLKEEEAFKTWRARTLVFDETLEGAIAVGHATVREAVGLFHEHVCPLLRQVTATDAGYLVDLKTGKVTALQPAYAPKSPLPGMFGLLDLVQAHPEGILNALLVTARRTYGELGEAVRRSFHWRQLAKSAEDGGEAFFLAWMSAECLCRVNRDEAMPPKFGAAAGFPVGQLARALDTPECRAVTSRPEYNRWHRDVTEALDLLREARNNIAHSGYRRLDLADDLNSVALLVADAVLPMIAKSLANMALFAISRGARTVDEMWKRYPLDVYHHGGLAGHMRWFLWRLDAIEKEAQRMNRVSPLLRRRRVDA